MVARLHDLEDSQLETTLLRSCLALPKVSHTLHTCPPCLIPKALDAFDDLMRGALSDLTGSPVPNWPWLKALLPSSLGGLNLRSASCHAPAASIGFPPMPSSGDQNQGKICPTSYTPCHLSSIPLQGRWAT